MEAEDPRENGITKGERVGERPPEKGGAGAEDDFGEFCHGGQELASDAADASAGSNDVPQPQERTALGLEILKPASDKSSE